VLNCCRFLYFVYDPGACSDVQMSRVAKCRPCFVLVFEPVLPTLGWIRRSDTPQHYQYTPVTPYQVIGTTLVILVEQSVSSSAIPDFGRSLLVIM
jgi:hypothetical protein